MHRLINGDCFEILRSMPDKSVDHVITDPPYSKQVHEGARTGSGANGGEVLIHFDSISEEQFFEICRQAVRISKRWVIMTCAFEHAGEALKRGLNVVRVGVWVKPNPTPQFTGDRPGQGFETVLIMHDKGRKKWNDGGMPAVWIYNKICGQHPTQKPLNLVEKWVYQFTDPNETILDPFMGSGTTGVAALKMGRNFIGIEIDQKYFHIAQKRIEATSSQQKLFES